ncbi:MAG TPA: S-methyl-5'-thioadenosine phosphorylase [Ktedonobacterales bacterium]
MPTPVARLAVIGGSGLYQMPGLADAQEITVQTPFGPPSDAVTVGRLGETSVAFLPRHGRGHRLTPTEVPARANLYALKTLGVEWVLSVSAVGSLREELPPLDLVIPDQVIDRTKSRPNTFFGEGVVAHVAFAEPFCPHLSGMVATAAAPLADVRTHRGGTYVCIEGPQFSTRAESNLYRQWGCDIIGMTAIPEAKLAREAELCYATIACITDYDVWRTTTEAVTVEMVVANLARNVANAQQIIRGVAASLPASRAGSGCDCAGALANAIMTDPKLITPAMRERYGPLLSKYL